MIEIIRRGEAPKEKKYERMCVRCDTVFTYQVTDLSHDRDGDYVVCPVCNYWINHSPAHGQNIDDR